MITPRYNPMQDGCPYAFCLVAAAAERAHRRMRAQQHAEAQAMAHRANVARLRRAEDEAAQAARSRA